MSIDNHELPQHDPSAHNEEVAPVEQPIADTGFLDTTYHDTPSALETPIAPEAPRSTMYDVSSARRAPDMTGFGTQAPTPQLATPEASHPNRRRHVLIGVGTVVLAGVAAITFALTHKNSSGSDEAGGPARPDTTTSGTVSPEPVSSTHPEKVTDPAHQVLDPKTGYITTFNYNISGHSAHENKSDPDTPDAIWNFTGPENQIKPTPIEGTTVDEVYAQLTNNWNAIIDISSTDANIGTSIVDTFGAPTGQLGDDMGTALDKTNYELFEYRLHTDPAYQPKTERTLLASKINADEVVLVDKETDVTGTSGTRYERFTLTKGEAGFTPGWIVTKWEDLQDGDTSLGSS